MTGIFYGSTTGATEQVASDIAQQLGVEAGDIHNVGESSADDVDAYDVLLLGSSTWGAGDLQDDWYDFLDNLKGKDLSGKKVGLFGCGDSGSYPDYGISAQASVSTSSPYRITSTFRSHNTPTPIRATSFWHATASPPHRAARTFSSWPSPSVRTSV